MSLLADFLDADSAVILERFAKRLDGSIAPEGLTTSQLVDHLPEFLTQVAQALRQGGRPSERLLRNSDVAHLHGAQRSSLGYDLNALVREYGVLRDTLYERMEEVELTPSLRELRILSDCLSGAIGDSVESYVDERQADSDEERKHLLGLFEQAPGFVCFLRGRELVFELANSAYYQMVGHREILGKTVRAALPEVEGQGFFELLDNVFSSGEAFVGRALKAELQRLPGAPLSEAYMDLIYQPIRAQDGSVLGILVQGNDVTEAKHQELRRRAAEEALRTSDARYRTLFESIDDGFCLIEL
ncbi:MAG: uncharacterized protein JWN04_2900, partial [Myxococcaceae bacterium]|nr:uncharacterized protein [Myxococcaceae bacterium]